MKFISSAFRSWKLSKHSILLPVATTLIFISSPYLSSAQDKKKVDSLQAQLKISKEDTSKVNTLINLCWELRSTYPEQANQLVKQAITLAEKIDFKKGIANAHNYIGSIYLYQGSYEKALEEYSTSLKLFREIAYKKGVALSYNNIGLIYSRQGNYDKALENYFASLKILEEIGDKKNIAYSYNYIGEIYDNQRNYDNALKMYFASLKVFEEISEKEAIAMSYNNIGLVYNTQSNYQKALENYFASLKICKEIGNKQGIAYCYNSIGGIYTNQGNYNSALKNHFAALKILQEIGDKSGISISYNYIGNVYLKQNKIEEAKKQNLLALNIDKEIGLKNGMSRDYQALSLCDSAVGNWKGAYEYQKLYKQINDSIFNDESAKKTAEMGAKYESEKKEAQILLLNKDNEIKEKDLSKQKTIRNFFIAGFSLIMLFSFLLYNRFQLTKKLNSKLDLQNVEITKKNVQITDSIDYAQRIQHAILPPIEEVKKLFPDSFIFFKPKNIVSGDFYWFNKKNGTVLFSAVDCTGHGVPGAFMSIIGYNLLQQSVEKSLNPAFILNEMNNEIATVLRQNNNPASVKDGMDMALCSVDLNKLELQYAGAKNPLYLVREQKLHEYKADKISIGKNLEGAAAQFTNQTVPVQKGDVIYLFSDGFVDQKGGSDGKKFYYPPFQQLLVRISELSMEEQKERLEKTITEWKGNREQMDDMLVIGVRI